MPYFYDFLELKHPKMASVAMELETSIYVSPRTMLTHSRILIEAILTEVLLVEKIAFDKFSGLKEKIELSEKHLEASPHIIESLEDIRKRGNKAAHDTRQFRLSEALQSWESLYPVVKWFVEVYGAHDVEVPMYIDPTPPKDEQQDPYGTGEIESRLAHLEELLLKTLDSGNEESTAEEEVAVTSEVPVREERIFPGFTTIRSLKYNGETLPIPYFLRDAFLLPQRFPRSELFLIRLGGEQEARLMSEIPTNLEGLHTFVKRFKAENDATLFEELRVFVEEEKQRRKVRLERTGELLFFYKSDYIVITDELGKIELTKENFKDISSLLNHLEAHDIHRVKQLPSELVVLGKYPNVGITTVEKLFQQLKEKQSVE
ncbi:DUF4145 domain-containing protein [Paenisporosarcina cavernae]|uniref:DUF4145 domain-containing protein n=1 Tax=Paenisporosarcina cavernae TaxID=2320858 RepID=A0A385YXK0_9BACL|nr:DUF4145 domain-containing protein [Paenisporosarcina cavernae]AYC30328.1 DUF4145 domain-containing protein [Paenisporosarcina cavernae]